MPIKNLFWKSRTSKSLISPVFIFAVSFLIVISCNPSADKEEKMAGPTVDPSELRTLPKEPEESLATFEIKEGFKIEQVAAEPLVVDPMAMYFDESGKLYVVEMRYYPEIDSLGEKIGSIRLLEDTNGDGIFDKSTVFADQLHWPTAVICYDGGVFVADTPNLLFLKDTTGDGKADRNEVVISGFGTEGHPAFFVQQMPNSFTWGLDNRIHGVTSGNGGRIKEGEEHSGLDLRGHDFSFDPRTLQVSRESGGLQHGMSFDDYGNKYVTRQSSHLEQIMYDASYADRNPAYVMPRAHQNIADDGAAAEVFRTSNEDPWRELRTRWTVEGLLVRDENQNLQWQNPGGERSVWQGGVGYDGGSFITSSSGITIYRGDAWPATYRGSSFIGEPNGNLVHRDSLYPNLDGIGMRGGRAFDELDSDFLTSTDNWFRPVQFANAPDGTLYMADMYREVIDLPSGIPSAIQQHLDLKSGNDRGRIYRIVPEGFKQPETFDLGSYSTSDLVGLLEHSNGWHTNTAARLLYQRQDKGSIPLLEKLLKTSKTPQGRLNALYALDGQKALNHSHVLMALEDSDASVRKHAVKLSEQLYTTDKEDAGNSQVSDRLLQLANDPHREVRYQLAFTLGEIEHPNRIKALTHILKQDAGDSWIHAAILSSLVQGGEDMFLAVSSDNTMRNSNGGDEFLRKLALMIGTQNDPEVVDIVIENVSDHKEESSVFELVTALGNGLLRSGNPLNFKDNPKLDLVFHRAAEVIQKGKQESERIQAIQLIGLATVDQAIPLLIPFLEPEESQEINLAVIESLGRFEGTEIAKVLIMKWAIFTPKVRRNVLEFMLARPERIKLLLNAIEEDKIASTELASTQIRFLQSHSDSNIKERALRILEGSNIERQEVINSFISALDIEGDISSGLNIYRAKCSSCHRIGDEGYAIGPDLATLGSRKAKLLVDIIDPNRDVSPNHLLHTIETNDGESLIGIVTSETTTSITLRRNFGDEIELLRSNIATIQSSEQSLMPDGLEAGMTPQEMANLLEFISKAGNK
ncbi:MAG: PVC-type heme-binding CxxCH protein [Cyclobacteriaceae bacterium]